LDDKHTAGEGKKNRTRKGVTIGKKAKIRKKNLLWVQNALKVEGPRTLAAG